ncbi:MAG: fibronectin type III domain-containing protein, partial [Actinobacteria bacterium]|nr:fibronectin type III domain-containing protein [Actinomycetota bacterium]
MKNSPSASQGIKATVDVVAPTAPGKPSAPTAVAGDGEATVSWSAASDTGGSAITGYTVTAVEDATKTCTPTPATGLTCTVAGLTNDTPYTFTLV